MTKPKCKKTATIKNAKINQEQQEVTETVTREKEELPKRETEELLEPCRLRPTSKYLATFRDYKSVEEKPKEDAEVELGLLMERKKVKENNTTRFKFCPRCSNLLVLNDENDLPSYRLQCPSCRYFRPICGRITYTKIIPKDDEDESEILDASKSDEHRQRTQVVCPECNHIEAFFYQMQTRSADEPMTNFYECANKQCKKNWRD